MTLPAEPAATDSSPAGKDPASDASPEIGLLKRLLFRSEQARLDVLQRETEALAARLGDSSRLEAATAEVLAGALRRAEISSHRELSHAMAPLVLAAIRSEIVNSRDMMVEALYPITGRLVAAAVANAFRDLVANINARIDQLLSTRLWRLRLRALVTGRPLSEILLEAAQRPQVRRLLALERGSGQVLAHWPAGAASDRSDELVGGLIAAISQFAAEAFASQHGELRTLDMGASRILLRASARLIIAAEFRGELHSRDEARMDRALFALIEQAPNGPDDDALAGLAADFTEPPAQKAKVAQKILLAALALGLAGWALYGPARNFWWERRLRAAYETALATQPDLAEWPLTFSVDGGRKAAYLRGLAPPDADLDVFARALAQAGTPYRLEMQVMRVATAQATDAASARLAGDEADLAQKFAEAQARAAAQQQSLDSLGARLEGVEHGLAAEEAAARAPLAVQARLAQESVIWFGEGVDFVDPALARRQIAALAAALKASGGGLRVVGYTDSLGTTAKNSALSQARAEAVVAVLLAEGVESSKLVAVGRGDQTAISAPSGADKKRNRRVIFEMLTPAEQTQ